MNNNIVEGYEFVPGAHLEGIVLPRGTDLTRFVSLSWIHLEGASLEGVIFRQGVNLRGAFFNNADLFQANLEDANLEDANFEGATLAESNLEGANFEDANLDGANLDGANLNGADLRFVLNLERALHADTRHAIMDDDDLEEDSDEEEEEEVWIPPIPPQGRAYDYFNQLANRVPPQGRAYEIHNYFGALDIDSIREFVQKFNVDNDDINGKTISNSEASQQEELFTPLLHFIENSELFKRDEKEDNKEKLNRILTIAKMYNRFDENKNLLTSIIEFVSKQSDDFIEQYIRIIKDECLNAYGQGGQSCVNGVFERIITTIGAVAIVLTQGSMNQDNETYKTLKKLFREINFSELVQEWASTYLEDGEKEEELKSLNVEQRKEHFIQFMTTKYGALITPIITEKIKKEADDYLVSGVFDRMAFGVKGTKRTRKPKGTKGTKRIKRIKGTKRTKGKRKTKRPKGTRRTKGKRKTKKNRRPRRSYKK